MTRTEPARPAPPALELAAVFLFALAYLGLANFRDGIFIWTLSPQEGGVWLDEAVRTLRGDLIYRDFFDFVAPGNVFLIACVLAVFGQGTAVVGGLVVGFGAATALLVHAVSARVLAPAWRGCATAIFLVYSYQPYSPLNHKWPALACCLAALLFVLPRRSVSRCVAAGIALAAATLFTQDLGIGAAAGLALGLWGVGERGQRGPFAAFSLAYAAALAFALGALALAVGPATLHYDLVEFPARQYGNAVRFGLLFGEPHAAARTFTVYALCVAGLVFALVSLSRGSWRTRPPELILVASLGMGLLLFGIWTRNIEPVGLGVRAMPVMIVGLYAAGEALAAGRSRIAVLLFLSLTLAATALAQLVHTQTRPLARGEHRAGAVWEAVPMEDLAWIERRTRPGDTAFLMPYKGGYEFLGAIRNPVAFPMLVDMGFTTSEQARAAGDQLLAACPAVGLWDHRQLAEPIERSSLRPVYLAIRRNYESQGRLGNGVEPFLRASMGSCAPN